jgi:thymidine kinase
MLTFVKITFCLLNQDKLQKGKLEIICGSMFSGKTKELITRAQNAITAKKKVIVFKPKIDNRYNSDVIISHDSETINCKTVDTAKQILSLSKNYDVVAIDEIQFFNPQIIDTCIDLINKGKRVIGAGLDIDYLGNPFGSVPQLLAIADEIKKFNAKCKCGNLAYISYRLAKEKSQILIGEKQEYEPRCRNCIN